MNSLVVAALSEAAAKPLVRTFLVSARAALLSFWVAGSCRAGDAVFSNDGTKIWAIGHTENQQTVREINLTEQTSRQSR
jgi:hypothetical protein